MNPDVLAFAQVSVIIVCLVGSLALIGAAAVGLFNSANRKKVAPAAHDDQRLEHLQQSIDAIAIEVERIAEAQRFTARLMSEREDVPKLTR